MLQLLGLAPVGAGIDSDLKAVDGHGIGNRRRNSRFGLDTLIPDQKGGCAVLALCRLRGSVVFVAFVDETLPLPVQEYAE